MAQFKKQLIMFRFTQAVLPRDILKGNKLLPSSVLPICNLHCINPKENNNKSQITIRKRDGLFLPFDDRKIYNALLKAFIASNESNNISYTCSDLTRKVVNEVTQDSMITVEGVQDKVEEILMKNDYAETARRYIIYRYQHSQIRRLQKDGEREITINDLKLYQESSDLFNHDPLRQTVYYRSYSRWLEQKGRRETWVETVDRYMNFMRSKLGTLLVEQEYEEVQSAILHQEVMPSMRLLHFAGPAAEKCNVSVYNCTYTTPRSIKDIVDILYLCMSGSGVGFSVEKDVIKSLPIVRKKNNPTIETFTIQDSKEGWCDALEVGLNTWYRGDIVNFDYSKIRPAGSRLRTTGGKASGPEALKHLLEYIKDKLTYTTDRKLTSIDVHDIICKIGEVVVSGGVRRTALISLSNLDDEEMRESKSGSFWLHSSHRSMANNSAVYNTKPSMTQFMKEWLSLMESGTGERGIFNRGGLMKVLPDRRIEILKEKIDQIGTNPCGEILLQNYQQCNLSEVVCKADDTVKTLRRKIQIATLIGTYQSTLTDFKYIKNVWTDNNKEERLLGVSLTGQWDCPVVRDPEVMSDLRQTAIATNEIYANRFNINRSTAITCVKPSGTVSQLVNSSSGMHPRFADYYIRRIRINAKDPILNMLKDQGYNVVPEVGQMIDTATTFVVEFPVKSPDGAITVDQVSAFEQLEYWKMVKLNYTEHNPSVTIYIKEDEWLQVGQWLWDNWDIVTGLSFLPYSDHIYTLAPYEKITKEQYEQIKEVIPDIDFSKLVRYENTDTTDLKMEPACSSGKCEFAV